MFQMYVVYEPDEWTDKSSCSMDVLITKGDNTYRWLPAASLFNLRDLTNQISKNFGERQPLEELVLSMVTGNNATVIHKTEHVLYLGTFESVDEFVNRMNLFKHMGLFNKGMREAFLPFVYESRHRQSDSV